MGFRIAGGGRWGAVPDDRVARVARTCGALLALCTQQRDAAMRQYASAVEQQARVQVMFERWTELRQKMGRRAAAVTGDDLRALARELSPPCSSSLRSRTAAPRSRSGAASA